MTVIGLDPGPEFSGTILWDGHRILEKYYHDTDRTLQWLYAMRHGDNPPMLVLEKVVSYGMILGQTTLETIYCSGRFAEAYGNHMVYRMPRLEVKQHICHNGGAKDGNIRQAIIDRLGGKDKAIGKKASPGVLYGVSGDLWAALALAITFLDTHK
jgi:hypothetical protein